MFEWVRFCKEKINKIEKLWNRKLEDSSTGDDDGSSDLGGSNKSKEEDDDNLTHEETISKILDKNIGNRFMNRSHVEPKRPNDKVSQDLSAAKESLAAKPKDDNDLVNATSGNLHEFETKFVQY